jgi:hypothetical protein
MASAFETTCKFIGSGISRDCLNVVLTASPEDANYLFFGSKRVILVVNYISFPTFKDVITELVRTTRFLTWLEPLQKLNNLGELTIEECMNDIKKNLKFRKKNYIPNTDKLDKKFGDQVDFDTPITELKDFFCQVFISFKKPRISKPQHPRVEAIKAEDKEMKAAQKAASNNTISVNRATILAKKGVFGKDVQQDIAENIIVISAGEAARKGLFDEPIFNEPIKITKDIKVIKHRSKPLAKRKPLTDITNIVDSIVKKPKNVLQKRVQIEKKLDQLKAKSTTVESEFQLPQFSQSEIDEILKA